MVKLIRGNPPSIDQPTSEVFQDRTEETSEVFLGVQGVTMSHPLNTKKNESCPA